jgi:hypothetical protein
MTQLLCHLCGDYVLQNHRMATRKTTESLAAAVHAATYTLPFLLLTRNPAALAVIVGTHFVIDRFRLARYWCRFWGTGQTGWLWEQFGYEAPAAPDWLAVWLLIIVDNTTHLAINAAALGYFA